LAFLKIKRRLSNAVSVPIILVSVLLAIVVAYCAINIASAGIQEECIQVTNTHVWANESQAVVATVIKNVGENDVVINELDIESAADEVTISLPFADDTYYWRATEEVTDELEYHYWDNATKLTGAYVQLDVQGSDRTFQRASTGLILPSGGTLVVYIRDPDSISTDDIGTPVSVTVYTVQAEYIEETNVQAGR